MNKKIVFLLVLSLCFTFKIFSQQIERLTFTELGLDGKIIGTVTVNAVFLGWNQQRISIENGFQVIRESVCLAEWADKKRWSDWELVGREPSRVSTIRQLYDIALSGYIKHPRAAIRMYYDGGFQAIRLMTIPNGQASPVWWSEDGKSFYVFYEAWIIVP